MRYATKVRFLLISVLLLFSATGLRSEETFPKIQFYGNFLYSESIPNTLFVFGEIENSDSYGLRKAMREHSIETLVLDSPGGALWEGLQIAAIARDNGIRTYIPSIGLSSQGSCDSACSFVFFAGLPRAVDGRLGVHQFYSIGNEEYSNANQVENQAQFTVSEIISYLNEFGTPSFVYERMFETQEMYYFDNDEISKIEIRPSEFSVDFKESVSIFVEDFRLHLRSLSDAQNEPPEPNVLAPAPPSQDTITLEKTDSFEEDNKQTFSETVYLVQKELNRLGCAAGFEDGVVGKKTRNAIDWLNSSVGTQFDYSSLGTTWLVDALKKIETERGCAVAISQEYADAEPGIHLIGIFGQQTDRRALVRLTSGRFTKLEKGDSFQGGVVLEIGEAELIYSKDKTLFRLVYTGN